MTLPGPELPLGAVAPLPSPWPDELLPDDPLLDELLPDDPLPCDVLPDEEC